MKSFERESTFDSEILKKLNHDNWLTELLKMSVPALNANDEYVTLQFFKDGHPFKDYNQALLEKVLKDGSELSEIPCSIRVTNCQKLSTDVMKMCLKLENVYKQNFTCNLYYTPGENKNCFNFHADHQIAYIFQISGQKEWIFPLENGECLKHLSNQKLGVSSLDDKPVKTALLSAGDQIFVPFGMIHKAEIRGNQPSLHLTFSTSDISRENFIQSYITYCLENSGIANDIKLPIESDHQHTLNQFNKALAEVNVSDFLEMFHKKTFGDNLLVSKFGRSYKMIVKNNQD